MLWSEYFLQWWVTVFLAIIVRNFSLCRAVEETAKSLADASEDKEEPPMESTRLREGSDGRGNSYPEDEDENEEADTVLKDDDFVPLAPSQKQLNEISFESSKFRQFAAILVDGAKYWYRIHRRKLGRCPALVQMRQSVDH